MPFDPGGPLPTGDVGWHALLDYVLARGGAVDDERDWLELKSELDLDTKAGVVSLARFAIAAANRHPSSAASHLGGHAVLLVGIQGGAVVGTKRVELNVFTSIMSQYVDENVGWDLLWLRREGLDVAALTVRPPDGQVHFARKTFQSHDAKAEAISDGEILVRRKDSSTRPTSAELQALLTRAATRANPPDFDLDVRMSGALTRVSGPSDFIDSLRNELKARFRIPGQLGLAALTSPRSFDNEIEDWLNQARQAWSVLFTEEWLPMMAHEMQIEVRNTTELDLADVRVQLEVPGATMAGESTTSWYPKRGLPSQPPGSIPVITGLSFVPSVPSPWRPTLTDRAAGTIDIRIGDIRPLGKDVSTPFFVVVGGDYDETSAEPLRLTATAKGIHQRLDFRADRTPPSLRDATRMVRDVVSAY